MLEDNTVKNLKVMWREENNVGKEILVRLLAILSFQSSFLKAASLFKGCKHQGLFRKTLDFNKTIP